MKKQARPITYRMQYKRRNKYGNRRVSMDGYTFDSIAEMNHYVDLKYRMLTGKISNLELQKPFTLQESFRDRDGKWQQAIIYKADFVYIDNKTGEQVIEDVKSEATKEDRVYKLKKKMMMYKGLYITEVQA